MRLKFAQCGYATNLCVMTTSRVRTPSSTSSRDSPGATSSIHLIVSIRCTINVIVMTSAVFAEHSASQASADLEPMCFQLHSKLIPHLVKQLHLAAVNGLLNKDICILPQLHGHQQPPNALDSPFRIVHEGVHTRAFLKSHTPRIFLKRHPPGISGPTRKFIFALQIDSLTI
jgi:hypothetical protein